MSDKDEFTIMNNALDSLSFLEYNKNSDVRLAAEDIRLYINQLEKKINDWVKLTMEGERTREKVMLDLILNSDKLNKPSSSSG